MAKQRYRLRETAKSGLRFLFPRRMAVYDHLQRMAADPDYFHTWDAIMRSRGYKSAQSTKSETPWTSGGSTADSEILGDLDALRNRSRELNRDDPIASGITRTFTNNSVGPGIRAQARVVAKSQDLADRKNAAMESVWADRKDKLDPDRLSYEQRQWVIARKICEDGGIFVKTAKTSAMEPIWFENIEADRVATPYEKQAGGADIRGGVERDESGRIVAYWVQRGKTSGDSVNAFALAQPQYDRVDAVMVNHVRQPERPGQSREVPMFHAVLQDIRDLDLLIVACLKRVQVGACLSAFIKSSGSLGALMQATEEQYGYRLEQDLEPGMLFKLYPDEELQTLVPNFPVPELEPFLIMLARRIGAAIGISWQIVLKDFSAANYSSARTDLLESRLVFRMLQSLLIPHFTWEWIRVMTDAKLRGDPRLKNVTLADIRQVNWIPPGWQWVDPLKEAQANQISLLIGSTTLRDLCAQNGQDWEEMQAQRIKELARERDLKEAAGLPLNDGASDSVSSAIDDEDASDARPPRSNGRGIVAIGELSNA